jgi:hypothetical protein
MAKKKIRKRRIQKPGKNPKVPASNTPVHPWRVCPYGEHQVIEHSNFTQMKFWKSLRNIFPI